ncbi:hypothetical protein HYY69_06360 [Candidatus Woesearchaeota archaeon]|nr:hypothetical protein [Candidatus Woesearchaeota archaeon]
MAKSSDKVALVVFVIGVIIYFFGIYIPIFNTLFNSAYFGIMLMIFGMVYFILPRVAKWL